MKLTCAAAALCGMKNTPLDNSHHCMMCEGPLHSAAFCGKLYCEEIASNPSYENPAEDLNDHAKDLATSPTAIMCLHCVHHKLTKAAAGAAAPPPAASAAANHAATTAAVVAPPPAAATTNNVDAKKQRDATLYAQFDITRQPNGKLRINCKHCSEYNKELQTFNATRARRHSLRQCQGLTCPLTKRRIELGSQDNKKRGTHLALQSNPSESVAAMRTNHGPVIDLLCDSEDVSDVTSSSLQSSRKKAKRAPSSQTTMEQTYGKSMNQKTADIVIMNEVRAIVARGEPLSRLLDPWVQASLNQRYPAILKFMPTNNETIYDKYVVKIDKETTAELNSFMAKLPGHVNVAMDGVTVLGKQKVRLPCSV